MQQKNKQHLFYKNGQLASAIGSTQPATLFTASNIPLAKRSAETLLTAVNSQNSIVNGLHRDRIQSLTYSTYGHSHIELILGYTGQRYNQLTSGYLLGNGYRLLNTRAMRFNSPDNFSPFGPAGINCYAYCMNDPINHVDPSGHILENFINKFLRSLQPRASQKRQHLKSHDKIDYARDKKIYNDVKSLINKSTPLESAEIVTAALPELTEHPNWYIQEWVTNEHLQSAKKIHNLMIAMTMDSNDRYLDVSGSAEIQNMRLKDSTMKLSKEIRDQYNQSTSPSSRRSSLASIRSTNTQSSEIY